MARVVPVETAAIRTRARIHPAPVQAERLSAFIVEDDIPEAEIAIEAEENPLLENLVDLNKYIEEGGSILEFDPIQVNIMFDEGLKANTHFINTLLARLLRILQDKDQLFRFNPNGTIDDMNDTVGGFPNGLRQRILDFVIRNDIHLTQDQIAARTREAMRGRASSRDRSDSDGAISVFPYNRSDSEEFEVDPLSVFFPRDMRSRSRSSDTVGSGIHYKAKYTRPPMIYRHRTKPRLK